MYGNEFIENALNLSFFVNDFLFHFSLVPLGMVCVLLPYLICVFRRALIFACTVAQGFCTVGYGFCIFAFCVLLPLVFVLLAIVCVFLGNDFVFLPYDFVLLQR